MIVVGYRVCVWKVSAEGIGPHTWVINFLFMRTWLFHVWFSLFSSTFYVLVCAASSWAQTGRFWRFSPQWRGYGEGSRVWVWLACLTFNFVVRQIDSSRGPSRLGLRVSQILPQLQVVDQILALHTHMYLSDTCLATRVAAYHLSCKRTRPPLCSVNFQLPDR